MQAALFDHLLCATVLSEAETSILKWGKNAKTKATPKRLVISQQKGTYQKATALECLVRSFPGCHFHFVPLPFRTPLLLLLQNPVRIPASKTPLFRFF